MRLAPSGRQSATSVGGVHPRKPNTTGSRRSGRLTRGAACEPRASSASANTPRVNVEAGLVDPPSFVYVNSVGSLSSAS
jgi:hypothetical protein